MKLGKAVKPLIKMWISLRGENCRSYSQASLYGEGGR